MATGSKKVTIEALDVNNWLKVCKLSVSEEQKAYFPSQMYTGLVSADTKKEPSFLQ